MTPVLVGWMSFARWSPVTSLWTDAVHIFTYDLAAGTATHVAGSFDVAADKQREEDRSGAEAACREGQYHAMLT